MQYTIVFAMKLVIIFLIALSCKLIQSGYGMTGTALGNAGLNAKPIDTVYLNGVNKRILRIKKDSHDYNEKVINVIRNYAEKNSD